MCYTNFNAVEKKRLGNPQMEKNHYSEKQKSILMKYFEEEEQTGIKKTPDQVYM